MKKKKKLKKIIIFAVIIVIIGIVVIGNMTSTKDTKPVVNVAKAKKGNITATLTTSGTVASEINMDYISPVNASVDKVNVEVGQEVKAGEFLVSYNTDELKSAYDVASLTSLSDQATANNTLNQSKESEQKIKDADAKIADFNSKIDAAKSDIAALNAELSAPNIDKEAAVTKQALLEKKTSELQDYQTQLATAQADKEAAQAGVMSDEQKKSVDYNIQVSKISVTNAENDFDNAKAGLAAEYDGIVTAVNVVNGSMATEGQTLITVARTSDMKVDFTISKYNLSSVKLDQPAKITVLNKEYSGKVSRMSKVAASAITSADQGGNGGGSSSASASSAMVGAQVHIDNPDNDLVVGIDADMVITTGEAKDVVTIPTAALNQDKKGDFVYIYENGKVKRKAVKAGLSSDSETEIKEGIKEGDIVVSEVDTSVEDGMQAETEFVND